MFVNAKMIPIETIPGIGGGIKENGGGSEFKYDIFSIEFCKCHNVPPPSTTKKKEYSSEYTK
jgi:hypothetical protein